MFEVIETVPGEFDSKPKTFIWEICRYFIYCQNKLVAFLPGIDQ